MSLAEDLHWAPLLEFRAHPTCDSSVVASDSVGKRLISMSSEGFMDLIVADGGMSGDGDVLADIADELHREGLLVDTSDLGDAHFDAASIDQWERDGWGAALRFYLCSIRSEFFDEAENYKPLLQTALTEMLAEHPVPLPPEIPEESAISVAAPAPAPETSVGEVLGRRRTSQVLGGNTLPQAVFSALMHHGFAAARTDHRPIVDEQNLSRLLQGCGVAFDPYLHISNVSGLEPGIYLYSISDERLKLISPGDRSSEICDALIGHDQAHSASCTVFLVAEFERFQWRYRHDRALRNLYADVGRLAQYFLLIATAYGVQTHLTPAAKDSRLAELLELDQVGQQSLYAISLGYRG